MKRLNMVLAAALLAGLVAAPAWAGDEAEAASKPKKAAGATTKPSKPRLWASHAEMEEACGLSEEQINKIVELNKARRGALKEFDEANGKKLKELKAKLGEAKKNDQLADAEPLVKEYVALMAKRKQIRTNARAKVMAVLLPEQKAKWKRYVAVRTMKRRFAAAKLTEEQIAQIGAAYVKLSAGANMSDQKAKAEVMKKLDQLVRKEILTDEQRQAVEKAKAERKLRIKKLRAEKARKAAETKPTE